MAIYARVDGGIVRELIVIPDDGPPIEDRFHPDIVATLWDVGQDVREGWVLDGDTLIAPPAPSVDEEALAASARLERDLLLVDTDTAVMRHREEVELGGDTSMSGAAYLALLEYRSALRAVPTQPGFPTDIDWPQAPA